mmetsp:Transcript_36599/g.117515  ORF Transcript_36599/g.117515 Transcript_36599/m.117515 type:complete len:431 (-) Transcript_36599:296-1588(-)
MYGGDEVSAVVMDIGSSTTKSGYAGEDCPKFVVPSHVGVLGGEEGASSEGARRLVGTSSLCVRRDGMRVESALTDGIITDWDAAESLIDHAFKSCLCTSPTEHPLLMAEPSFNTPAAREKLAELMFEKFSCPALFLSKSAVLSAFAAGRGTALVLEMGGGVTSATAVHDGYALSKPLRRSSLGGDTLTQMLLTSLASREPPVAVRPIYTLRRVGVGPGEESTEVLSFPGTHPTYHRYMQLAVLRDVKESVCRVALAAPSEGAPLDASAWEVEMPDHSSVDFGWERLHLPELLFTPTLLSAPYAAPPAPAQKEALAGCMPDGVLGLPEMVSDCIRACDTDMRRELWGSIVVSGGGSLLPGLTDRLTARLSEMVPQMSMKVKLLAATTPSERRFAVWIGGSILASLGSFQQLWMSKQEYDEQGANAIHRKCP